MKIKVTSTIILDTDKIKGYNSSVRIAIEREAFNKGSNRVARIWAWEEANKQDIPNITLDLL
uniref:Uncharacterized protein n=1 Tax=viral metagenome TaxID=1070528 RepID=A0A6M3LWB1_9ZZZZ